MLFFFFLKLLIIPIVRGQKRILVWPKSLFGFFREILQKDPNKLFGQLNIMSVQVSSHSQCGVMIPAFKVPKDGAACWGPSVPWSLITTK